jgi:hypothetical protein
VFAFGQSWPVDYVTGIRDRRSPALEQRAVAAIVGVVEAGWIR